MPQRRKKIIEKFQLLKEKDAKQHQDIVEIASYLCNTPIAFITILDDKKEYFLAKKGMNIESIPLEDSFCVHAINESDGLFVVENTLEDNRFTENIFVKKHPNIRFYAGAVLKTEEGIPIGTLCVLDVKKRTLDDIAIGHLEKLGRQVEHLIALRKSEVHQTNLINELRNEKSSSKNLVENINGIFWEANVNPLKFTFISKQVSEILGYQPEEWINVHEFWEKNIHPDERESIIKECFDNVAKKIDHVLVYRFKNKEGKYIWVQDRVKVHVKNDEVYKLNGIIIDIDQLKNLEENLLVQTRFNEAILKELPSLFYLFDEELNHILWNDVLLKHSGYSHEEFKNLKVSELFEGEELKKVSNTIEKVYKDGVNEVEAFLKSKDGNLTPFYFKAAKINYYGKNCVFGVGIDLSKRNELENKLRLSNERFRLLNSAISESIYEFDIKTHDIYFEENFSRIFGIKNTGNTFNLDYYEENIEAKNESDLKRTFLNTIFNTTDESWEKTYPIINDENKLLWVYEKAVIKRGENQEPLRVVGSLKNITDSFYLEQISIYEKELLTNVVSKSYGLKKALDKFLENIESLFPGMRASIMLIEDDKLVSLSGSSLPTEYLEEINGIEIGPYIGSCGTAAHLKKRIIVSDVYKDDCWKGFTYLADKYNFTACWSHPVLGDNNEVIATFAFYYKEKKQPDENELKLIDRIQHILSIVLSKEKFVHKIEAAVERFEIATKASNDAIWEIDFTKKSIFLGEGFKSLFGYEIDSAKFDTYAIIDKVHPENKADVETDFYRVFKDPTKYKLVKEFPFLRADGKYVYVSCNAIFIKSPDGLRTKKVIGAINDVTKEREYQFSLEKLNDELELHAKNLEDKNKELEQFAYIASHDLKEPTRMVKSFMNLLKTKYGDQLDDKAKTYIDYAVKGSDKMAQVINDLLEFSRAGNLPSDKVEFNIPELIENFKLTRKDTIRGKKATIHYEGIENLTFYPTTFMQVLFNLLDNALKYSKTDIKPEIYVKCNQFDNYIEFSVEDNGIGIDNKFLEKIFIIFQRLHGGDSYQGTGIGLAIAKKLVEKWGGEISVKSEPDKGSTFYFTIPNEC